MKKTDANSIHRMYGVDALRDAWDNAENPFADEKPEANGSGSTPNGNSISDRSSASSPITGEKIKAMKFEPIKHVVPGIIVEGLTLFAGKPKIGKSWLLLHAATAVARGGFTLGEIKCEEGDVLFCALEDNLRRLKSRMAKLLGMDADWSNRLYFKTEMPRLADGGLEAITNWIVSVPHPRLVIIDTLAMVRSIKKRDENPYEADYAAAKELRALAAEHHIAIVLVHHLRKQDSDDAFDTISGTLASPARPTPSSCSSAITAGPSFYTAAGAT